MIANPDTLLSVEYMLQNVIGIIEKKKKKNLL